MAISESQLNTWSNQGATVTSASAYSRIEKALTKPGSKLADVDKEIYLQGSYRNATNIYGDSDIDVVVQLNETWGRDLSALPPDQQERYHRDFSAATYLWPEFRADVIADLQAHFGTSAVDTTATKSIKVDTGLGRPSDIVPALHYRQYHHYVGPKNYRYTNGIKFSNSKGNVVINFPKSHIANGQAKNADDKTGGAYKPGVRMFKNARNRLIDEGMIADGLVPSYFLECLLYNVPDVNWTISCNDTYPNVVNYLWNLDLDKCTCQNELLPLFGSASTQWDTDSAIALIQQLITLWNDWS